MSDHARRAREEYRQHNFPIAWEVKGYINVLEGIARDYLRLHESDEVDYSQPGAFERTELFERARKALGVEP